ncbi:MAG: hypothetical protein NXI29_05285 [bacterium]|uniref:Uncharacterized protein n=1 Tax=Gimesia benthica TaxID=2608982 RepID=A0A6I6AG62_9PLAN|nr:hypothetical protein [Gimesia benthica]MCR9230406.1 hypothetical protein [bacterium]QGQ25056.1 hypothetical protein F1728_21235 [Gimesia benthica]
MFQTARHALMFLCCAIVALDIVLFLGGPALVQSEGESQDWFFSEFEFEENEESGEEEPLIQDVELLIEVSHLSSPLFDVEYHINESDRDETHVSRGPPALS